MPDLSEIDLSPAVSPAAPIVCASLASPPRTQAPCLLRSGSATAIFQTSRPRPRLVPPRLRLPAPVATSYSQVSASGAGTAAARCCSHSRLLVDTGTPTWVPERWRERRGCPLAQHGDGTETRRGLRRAGRSRTSDALPSSPPCHGPCLPRAARKVLLGPSESPSLTNPSGGRTAVHATVTHRCSLPPSHFGRGQSRTLDLTSPEAPQLQAQHRGLRR